MEHKKPKDGMKGYLGGWIEDSGKVTEVVTIGKSHEERRF